jgi:hypothetical protein
MELSKKSMMNIRPHLGPLPLKRENRSPPLKNLYDWIGWTLIRKNRIDRKLFPLLGERIKGEGERKRSIR